MSHSHLSITNIVLHILFEIVTVKNQSNDRNK